MFGLRLPELLLILAVVLVLFGANKLPALGQGLGEGLRSFKKAFRDGKEEDEAPAALPSRNQTPESSTSTAAKTPASK